MATSPDRFDQSLEDLLRCWRTSPESCGKVSAYFPAYVQLFDRLRGTKCVFVETGVLNGGSLFMWREWLGPDARIIGIDLNPAAKKWEQAGFEIFIGDQGDRQFWRETLPRIGRFDVLLDDGGHRAFQQMVTASEALRFATHPCQIVIEDTFTSFMKDFGGPSRHSFLEYAKAATDCLTGRAFHLYPRRIVQAFNNAAVADFSNVVDIQFFTGMVCFHADRSRVRVAEDVTNHPPTTPASDFRYDGVKDARVAWPNVSRRDERVVGDGDGKRARLRYVVRSLEARLRSLVQGRGDGPTSG
jgi:hypothetical protein